MSYRHKKRYASDSSDSEQSYLKHQQKKDRRRRSRSREREREKKKKEEEIEKEQVCWEASGILAKIQNTIHGVQLKFTESQDSHLPTDKWDIYVFKEKEELPKIYLRKQSCFLIGRDRKVVDILAEHPSISSQHSVVQFRRIHSQSDDMTISYQVKPYLIDINSTNGTYLNGDRIEQAKYYEIFEDDVVKFGFSQREYVFVKQKNHL